MSESKPAFSADDLDRLLQELDTAAAKKPADEDIERALQDILGKPAAAGSVFEPVQPQAAAAQPAAGLFGEPAAAKPVRSAAQPAAPAPQPVKPAAGQQPSAVQAIPEQQRKPFSASAAPLDLDDSPLVTEDFRRFFTTSVTPDALFSSNTETGFAAQRGHSAHSFLHRTKHGQEPVDPLPEQPVLPEEEEEEDLPMPAPREKRGLVKWLRSVFAVEEGEEDGEETEETAGAADPPAAAAAEQPSADPAGSAIDPAAEAAEDDVKEYVRTAPAPQPEGASAGTVIFEMSPGAAAGAAPASSTVVFDPVRTESSAEDAVVPNAATTVFDAVRRPEADGKSPAASAGEVEEIFEGTAVQPEQPAQSAAEEPAEQTAGMEQTAGSVSADADEENYTDAVRKDEMAAGLRVMITSLTLRAAILAVLALTAVWFGLAAAIPALPQPTGLAAPENEGLLALLVSLVSLLIGGAVSWPVMKNGFTGLWQQPTEDSFAALGCIGALVQTLVLLVNAGGYAPEKQMLYTAPAMLALLANALGKRLLVRGVQRNFERLSNAHQQYAVAALLRDESLVRRLTHGLGESEPCLLVSRPAGYFSDFMSRSFAPRPGERRAQRLCQALAGLSLLAGLLAVMFEGSLVQSFAGVLCLGCPLTQVLNAAVPVALMNRSAEANGSVLPGPDALEELGQANVVVADASDLFPAGSVLLKGLKVFGEPRIDLAILYAAALLVPNCPTLRSVFLNIIQDRTEILPEVENLHREVGCGFEGWSGNRHLLVGNRGMMIAHGVEVPPVDYELRYTKEGRYCPVYLAVNGRLYAMFVVGYRPDAEVKEMLDEIYVSGLSLLVTSDDFNLTGEKIDTLYGIPSGCIKVLGEAESRQLASHTAYVSRCEGAMAHATSFKGFIAGIRIAANGAVMEKTAAALQMVSVLLSALLVLVLTCTGGLGALGLPAVLLYQLAWAVLILMLPLARQY